MLVTPIGRVQSSREEMIDDDWDSVSSRIVLDPEQVGPAAVAGLDQFSHIEVVFVFDQVDPDAVERGARHPRGNPDWPNVGILAQRARMRPNRLGVTVCRLLDVDGLSLVVGDLDAVDGTPVLDVKPYMAEFGPRRQVRQPEWSHELMDGYWRTPAADSPVPATTGASYDMVAGDYAASLGGELAHKPLDRALLSALAEMAGPGPMADVGAGPGQVASFLADQGRQVVASDLSPEMCLHARRAGRPVFAADMGDLPLRNGALAALTSFYAVIHLDRAERVHAYREFHRVLADGGMALIAFHVDDPDHPAGSSVDRRTWWGVDINLVFRFLDPELELAALAGVGFEPRAALVRQGAGGDEYPSRRAYLLVQRPPR